jgi:hydroxymethylglutaryl-CoA synthase
MQTNAHPGISAIQLYVPQYRVDLRRWCEWTQNSFDKVGKVVGTSFRMPGPRENVYTMAATAVLELILANDLDASTVGFLALGTESSTDNAAGAVIVKGMVDRALQDMGREGISRNCEVPEFKHACLGGIYATKSALRWTALEGDARKAIVVSADVAEYARGSSGEQTQGAGAVAFLIERSPRLLEIDLTRSGSAAAYRGADFRKPVSRHFGREDALPADGRLRDFPVFNGRYSTHCYLDQVVHAFLDHMHKSERTPITLLEEQGAIFFHRPYHHLPSQALATLMVFGLARSGERGRGSIEDLCASIGCDARPVFDQLCSQPDLERIFDDEGPESDPYSAVTPVVKALRASREFKQLQAKTMRWGDEWVKELGNLYTASLPAWMACGLADAARRPGELRATRVLAVGYGSGDAAEVLPCTLVPGWEKQARAINVAGALANATTLDRETYEALHAGEPIRDLVAPHDGRFVVEAVGRRDEPNFQDVGIERYRWVI